MMKMKYFAWIAACIFSACSSTDAIKQFGSGRSPQDSFARLYNIGVMNQEPFNIVVKLRQIDQSQIAFNPNIRAYDMDPGDHGVYYQFISITDMGRRPCKEVHTGLCWGYDKNWLIHAYRISANLKSGYVYVPIPKGDPKSAELMLCLYGEPLGTTGQGNGGLFKVGPFQLSKDAELVACGELDYTITYPDP